MHVGAPSHGKSLAFFCSLYSLYCLPLIPKEYWIKQVLCLAPSFHSIWNFAHIATQANVEIYQQCEGIHQISKLVYCLMEMWGLLELASVIVPMLRFDC